MSTTKQKRVAKLIIENATLDKPITGGEIAEKVGYALDMQRHPKRVIETQGVKDALREYGLTEELVTTALVYDIENKPKGRLPELRLASEILGMTEHESGGNKTLIINIVPETAQRYEITTPDIKESN